MYAITVVPGKYLYTVGHVVAFTNHSCDPTLVFDSDKLTLTTKRDVQKGEMFTFDYTLTEPNVVAPFKCLCGSSNCKGAVGNLESSQ